MSDSVCASVVSGRYVATYTEFDTDVFPLPHSFPHLSPTVFHPSASASFTHLPSSLLLSPPLGGALQCAMLSGRMKVKPFTMVDKLPYGLVVHYDQAADKGKQSFTTHTHPYSDFLSSRGFIPLYLIQMCFMVLIAAVTFTIPLYAAILVYRPLYSLYLLLIFSPLHSLFLCPPFPSLSSFSS